MIQNCPNCNKPIKGIKMMDDYEYPDWDCDCKVNPANYREKIIKEKVITYENTRIDRFFLQNDFRIMDRELLPFFENMDWIESGKSLFIYGIPGTKKTGQVTAICKRMYNHGISVLYYRTTEIPYQRNMEEIKKVSLLVLDNFAKDSFENSRSAIFDLVDFRIHNYLSTILITNTEKNKIPEIYDFAFADRIKLFKKIHIQGESARIEL